MDKRAEMWIARDGDGTLVIFRGDWNLHYNEKFQNWTCDPGETSEFVEPIRDNFLTIDKALFPEIQPGQRGKVQLVSDDQLNEIAPLRAENARLREELTATDTAWTNAEARARGNHES